MQLISSNHLVHRQHNRCQLRLTHILESPEVEIQQIPRPTKMNRKRKRPHSEWESAVEIGGVQRQAADLLPLQKDVLEQQMKFFSAQLQLIEEQREYYRLKKQN